MEQCKTEQENEQTMQADLQNAELNGDAIENAVEEPIDLSVLMIALDGRLDAVTAPKLEDKIKNGLDGVEKLVLDMKCLNYVASAGLRVLLSAGKIMSARGGMKVINVNDEIMDVFRATGFDDILTIE